MSETLDWARTLVVLGVESIDADQARDTLHILLKYQTDIERAAKELAGVERPTEVRGHRHARSPLRLRHRAARRGLPVSLTEHLDAAEALRHIPLEDREALKYTLGATPGEVVVALAGLRDGLRDLLLAAAGPSTGSTTTRTTRTSRRRDDAGQMHGQGDRARPGPWPGRWRAARG